VLQLTDHPTLKRTIADNNENEFATFVIDTPLAPIPKMLESLGIARSAVKKQILNYSKESVQYLILKKRENAIKVSMNSVYGCCGTNTMFGHPEIGASVTAYGRDIIRFTANYIQVTYPKSVIAGGDTDSVYFTLDGEDSMERSFNVGNDICIAMNQHFGAPIELEIEKVYTPMMYIGKKCYFAMMYEHAEQKEGILDVKGIALARGDTSRLTKNLQLAIINAVVTCPNNPWPQVLTLVTTAITEIKNMDTMLLIKSKKLGVEYKYPDRQIQVQVAKRIKARGSSQPPLPGDCVEYLVTKGIGRICDRTDEPSYVAIENIDYAYYINSQIIKPLKKILDILKLDWNKFIDY